VANYKQKLDSKIIKITINKARCLAKCNNNKKQKTFDALKKLPSGLEKRQERKHEWCVISCVTQVVCAQKEKATKKN
jgi:hypothetical protein